MSDFDKVTLDAKAREMVEQARRVCEEYLTRFSQLPPTTVLLVREIPGIGKLPSPAEVVIPAPSKLGFNSDAGKDQYRDAISEVARDTRALVVIFISEAWVRTVAIGEGPGASARAKAEALKIRVKDDPNRMEAVVIHIETAEGFSGQTMAPIERDSAQKFIRLGEWSEVPWNSPAPSEGRFTSFLSSSPPTAKA